MKKQEVKSTVGNYETYIEFIEKWVSEIKQIDKSLNDCKSNKEYQELIDKRFVLLLRLRRDSLQMSNLAEQEIQICKEFNC